MKTLEEFASGIFDRLCMHFHALDIDPDESLDGATFGTARFVELYRLVEESRIDETNKVRCSHVGVLAAYISLLEAESMGVKFVADRVREKMSEGEVQIQMTPLTDPQVPEFLIQLEHRKTSGIPLSNVEVLALGYLSMLSKNDELDVKRKEDEVLH